ncbi:mitochondrial import inner membrane translocase [Striga asiatica]|uniref:Mitochondrial import inner membrane translocase n=1 Tax=Striga asiatica TaxID=4170 RepID=A0A5A7P946_STRAF|nr:mitochondrial import inner membrane translocase [Striga asiatica]
MFLVVLGLAQPYQAPYRDQGPPQPKNLSVQTHHKIGAGESASCKISPDHHEGGNRSPPPSPAFTPSEIPATIVPVGAKEAEPRRWSGAAAVKGKRVYCFNDVGIKFQRENFDLKKFLSRSPYCTLELDL